MTKIFTPEQAAQINKNKNRIKNALTKVVQDKKDKLADLLYEKELEKCDDIMSHLDDNFDDIF